MLTTILSFSDDDVLIIVGILFLLIVIPLCAGLLKAAKNKDNSDNHSPPKSPPPPQSYPNLYTTQTKDNAKNSDSSESKCIFCGHAMDKTQTFCGACGRRKD